MHKTTKHNCMHFRGVKIVSVYLIGNRLETRINFLREAVTQTNSCFWRNERRTENKWNYNYTYYHNAERIEDGCYRITWPEYASTGSIFCNTRETDATKTFFGCLIVFWKLLIVGQNRSTLSANCAQLQ